MLMMAWKWASAVHHAKQRVDSKLASADQLVFTEAFRIINLHKSIPLGCFSWTEAHSYFFNFGANADIHVYGSWILVNWLKALSKCSIFSYIAALFGWISSLFVWIVNVVVGEITWFIFHLYCTESTLIPCYFCLQDAIAWHVLMYGIKENMHFSQRWMTKLRNQTYQS